MASDRDQERRKRLALDEEPPAQVQPEEPPAQVLGGVAPYHVTGPGSVFHNGKAHHAGASLTLTAEEALSFGEAIAPGHKTNPVDPANAKPGSYKITQLGSILKGGKMHGPGTVIELTAEEAASFYDRIEAVA